MDFRSETLVALGSNLPNSGSSPQLTLGKAVAAMAAEGLVIRRISRFFATPCFPIGAGPDYVNAAVVVQTALPPQDVLHILHRIEAAFGRERVQRWGMRTLDLDLIMSGDRVIPDRAVQRRWARLPAERQAEAAPQELILPHPRLADRAFVLVPAADIAPGWVHPSEGVTLARLLARLPAGDIAAVTPI